MNSNKTHILFYNSDRLQKPVKFLVLLFFISQFLTAFSQEKKSIAKLQGTELNTTIRLNYIPVDMPLHLFPTRRGDMGIIGLHYQASINKWLYGGVAMHFAVTGDQGGLFTLGAELGMQQKIYKNLFFDANFHFGGGGGFRSLVKSGGFINPNIGLKYKLKKINFGVQFSNINFYSGVINSNSVSFFIEIPNSLYFSDYTDRQQVFTSDVTNSDYFWKKPATKNVQQIRFDFLFPFGKSKRHDLTSLTNTLALLEFEYQRYLNKSTFAYVHSGAIYKGLRAGFMDLFFGIGHNFVQTQYINLFAKMGIGAAGGRIAAEGGLTMYPSTGFDVKLSKNVSLSSHVGYYRALAGEFEAYTLGFGVKYNSLNGGTESTSDKKHTQFKTLGNRINFQNQTYFNAQKTDAPFSVDLQMIGMQYTFDITDNIYYIGEASFAYGGESGGYAHGITGLGIKTNPFIKNKMRAHLEIVGGIAGGAGVDTGEGIVYRPTIGLSYEVVKNVALFASAGKMIAPFGNFNTTNVNIGLSFGMSTLSVKK